MKRFFSAALAIMLVVTSFGVSVQAEVVEENTELQLSETDETSNYEDIAEKLMEYLNWYSTEEDTFIFSEYIESQSDSALMDINSYVENAVNYFELPADNKYWADFVENSINEVLISYCPVDQDQECDGEIVVVGTMSVIYDGAEYYVLQDILSDTIFGQSEIKVPFKEIDYKGAEAYLEEKLAQIQEEHSDFISEVSNDVVYMFRDENGSYFSIWAGFQYGKNFDRWYAEQYMLSFENSNAFSETDRKNVVDVVLDLDLNQTFITNVFSGIDTSGTDFVINEISKSLTSQFQKHGITVNVEYPRGEAYRTFLVHYFYNDILYHTEYLEFTFFDEIIIPTSVKEKDTIDYVMSELKSNKDLIHENIRDIVLSDSAEIDYYEDYSGNKIILFELYSEPDENGDFSYNNFRLLVTRDDAKPTVVLDDNIGNIFGGKTPSVDYSSAGNTKVANVVFDVVELSTSAKAGLEAELAKALLKDQFNLENYVVLSISPLDANGLKITKIDGLLRITIPVPASIDASKPIAIYHVNADGTVSLLKSTVNNDGTITFEVSEFSNFVIANVSALDNGKTLPATGTVSNINGYIAAFSGLVLISVSRRKRED